MKETRAPAQWLRNGKPLTSVVGGKYEMKAKNGVHTLLVRNLGLDDADVYEIETAGIKGSAKLTVLEAEKKPKMNWKPKKIEAEADKPLILKIPYQVEGAKKANPEAVLLRHGKPVGKDEGIEVEVGPEFVQIKLKSAKKGDTGKWELNLTNTGGTSSAPFELEVRGRPGAPEGPLGIDNITAESCDLQWKPPTDDGNSPIQGYLLEAQEDGGDWKKIGETKNCNFKVGSSLSAGTIL